MFKLAALTLFLVASPLPGQQLAGTAKWADSLRILIEPATNARDGGPLDQVIALADRVLTIAPQDAMIQHYKGYALYRKAGLLMADESKKEETKALLEEAADLLESSSKSLKWPETFALHSAVLGQIIGVDPGPIVAMRNGMRSGQLMEQALDLGPNNPRVWLLKGSGEIFTPAMFGGGADKAIESLKKSVALFAQDAPARPLPAWGLVDAYVWLGQAHAAEGQKAEARAAYQKALELVPEHGWVKYQLLPALDKK